METKCECGGRFQYVKENTIISKTQKRKIGIEYFSGIHLNCERCHEEPIGKVFIPLALSMVENIYTKSDFAALVGLKPQSVDAMSKGGRIKLVSFAKKEFVYYDKH